MRDVIAFVIVLPITVELLGALYAVFDAWRDRDSRAAALERLALPLAAWGVLWWWVGAGGLRILVAALVVVLAGHIIVFYVSRWLVRRPAIQTIAVDTDQSDEP